MNNNLQSALYVGAVRHRRLSPKAHEFTYKVCMVYLDLSEIETVFSMSRFWSMRWLAPVRFKRNDFHIDKFHNDRNNLPTVDGSVRNTVEEHTGSRPTGPIRMLVNLRYWGYNMNPLSTYYCFDDEGENLVAILAEVHNTPWNERHAYVLSADNFGKKQKVSFKKELHVSPFNPIDMQYQWLSTTPDKTLAIHLENWRGDKKIMDATLTLSREPITERSMNLILIRFPFMTVKTITSIYWQAMKLWLKGVPLFNHSNADCLKPENNNTSNESSSHHSTTSKINISAAVNSKREISEI